jgi:hypothetical protein
MLAEVTAAGVDTWSPSWYVHPEGPAARWLSEHATIPSKRGSKLLSDQPFGYRVGWFQSGLLFAEGHPGAAGELCPADELPGRFSELREALLALGVPVPVGERAFWHAGPESEGFAGFRRCDATVNLAMPDRAHGLAVLAGVAAAVRSAPGKAEVFYGPDRAVETVALLGHAGNRMLGRWYDKALEAAIGPRGTVIRGEDQRRWSKNDRRDIEDMTGWALRSWWQRRFLPLYQATKGVTVAGPLVLAEKLYALVEHGELTPREAESLMGHVTMVVVGGRRGSGVSKRTMYNREKRIREFGLQLADGVLEEVEVNVGEVLEQALETDAWERRG